MRTNPPVLNGMGGLSVKASGPTGASHHYSITSIDTKGTITWEGRVCPAKARSWLNREFGSHIFPEAVQGWDWFSLRLEDHSEIMIFIVRFQSNEIALTSYGTYVSPAANS